MAFACFWLNPALHLPWLITEKDPETSSGGRMRIQEGDLRLKMTTLWIFRDFRVSVAKKRCAQLFTVRICG